MNFNFIIYYVLSLFFVNKCFSMKIIGISGIFSRIPLNLTLPSNKYNSCLSFLTSSILFQKKMTTSTSYTIGLDPFCFKQFEKKAANFIPYPREAFLEKVRESLKNGTPLRDGYAPFCKHLFIKNFTEASSGSVMITPENEHLLKSGYLARTANELPVLSRWFVKSEVLKFVKKAEYLDIILYSREQVIKERTAMNTMDEADLNFDYFVISIKPQDVDHELPMMPITIMRNALIDQGGSGVPIDKNKYLRSVDYWSKHAIFVED